MELLSRRNLVIGLTLFLITGVLAISYTAQDEGAEQGEFPESFDLPLLDTTSDCTTQLANCHDNENSGYGATAYALIETGEIPQVDGGDGDKYVIPREGTLEYQCTEGDEAYINPAEDDLEVDWFQGGASVDGRSVPLQGELQLQRYEGWEGIRIACFDYDVTEEGAWAGTWAGWKYHNTLVINEPPAIRQIEASDTQVRQDEEVELEAQTEHEYNAAVDHEWSGDGDITEVGSTAYIEFATSGSKTVEVTAETSDGLSDTEQINIVVFEEPELLALDFDETITEGETASANIEVDNLGDAEIEWSNGDTRTFTDFTYEEPGQKTETVEIYNAETGDLVEERELTIIVEEEEDDQDDSEEGLLDRIAGLFTGLF